MHPGPAHRARGVSRCTQQPISSRPLSARASAQLLSLHPRRLRSPAGISAEMSRGYRPVRRTESGGARRVPPDSRVGSRSRDAPVEPLSRTRGAKRYRNRAASCNKTHNHREFGVSCSSAVTSQCPSGGLLAGTAPRRSHSFPPIRGAGPGAPGLGPGQRLNVQLVGLDHDS